MIISVHYFLNYLPSVIVLTWQNSIILYSSIVNNQQKHVNQCSYRLGKTLLFWFVNIDITILSFIRWIVFTGVHVAVKGFHWSTGEGCCNTIWVKVNLIAFINMMAQQYFLQKRVILKSEVYFCTLLRQKKNSFDRLCMSCMSNDRMD